MFREQINDVERGQWMRKVHNMFRPAKEWGTYLATNTLELGEYLGRESIVDRIGV
jgi:hypothetical protein